MGLSVTPLETRHIETSRLSNQIRVISEHMPHAQSISVGVWVANGSRRESGAESGISHFLEHMLFKGTTSRSAEDIAQEVDSLGGHLDAFTAKELISYNTKVIAEHLPAAFDVLSDVVLNPLFREEDIEKEKGVILEELKMEEDNPEYVVHETFISRFWKGHALGRPIIGTRKTIRAFHREMLRDYHARTYQPSQLLITAAGRVDHDLLVRLAEARFGSLPSSGGGFDDPPPATYADITYKKKKLQQAHLCLGVPAYPVAHPQRYGSYLLSTILGGGMSSRLFQNIRERQGLAYAVFSELNLFRDTGCLAIYAGTSPDQVRRVVASILEEFRDLKDRRVSAEELRRAKDHLKGSLILSLESTSSRMANLARQELYFSRFISMEELRESIEAVTAEELRGIAQESFHPDRIGLTVLGAPEGPPIDRSELAC
jgi:predicted Zn-dependent peptidase